MTISPTDEELITGIARNQDRQAFQELFDRYAKLAYGLARSLSVNEADADDIVQTSMLRIWVKAGQFKSSRGSARSWILSLVAREALQAKRAKKATDKRHVRRQEIFPSEPMPSPDTRIESTELSQLLHEKLQAMPISLRRILALYFACGMTQHEIANALVMPRSTVGKRIEEGVSTLRGYLKQAGFSAAPPLLVSEIIRDAVLHGPPPSPGLKLHLLSKLQSVSRRSARAATAKSGAWTPLLLAAGFLLVASAAGRMYFRRNSTNFQPSSTGESAITSARFEGDANTPSAESQGRFSRTWDFNTPEPPQDLQVLEGQWHYVPGGGPDGSGCMEIDTPQFLLRLDVPIRRFPVRVSYSYRLMPTPGISSFYNGLFWEEFSWGCTFHDAGRGLVFMKASDWPLARCYIGERLFDKWEGENRTNLNAFQRAEGCDRIVLYCEGRFQVDRITIEEVPGEEIPDVLPFAAALEQFGPDERRGSHPRPNLPPGESGKTVTIKFFTGNPMHNYFVPEREDDSPEPGAKQ